MKKYYLLLMTLIFVIQASYADSMFPASIRSALKHSTDVNYISVVIALGVVIMLIYITGIVYAKLNIIGHNAVKKQYKGLDNERIFIHSTTQIGNNKTLHVIEIAGKKLLIGVTNESINLIKDLDENSTSVSPDDMQSLFQKELSKTMPLDKIYPQNEDTYKEEEISIDKKIPEEIENINDNPTCNNNNDDFGLYKKYL